MCLVILQADGATYLSVLDGMRSGSLDSTALYSFRFCCMASEVMESISRCLRGGL